VLKPTSTFRAAALVVSLAFALAAAEVLFRFAAPQALVVP